MSAELAKSPVTQLTKPPVLKLDKLTKPPAIKVAEPPAIQRSKPPAKKSEALLLPETPVGKAIVFVRDGFMHIYAMVGTTLLSAKIRLEGGYDATRARVMDTLLLLNSSLDRDLKRASGYVMVVKGRLSEAGSQISTRVVAVRDSAEAKALEMFSRAREIILKVPVPAKVSAGIAVLTTQVGSFALYVKNGFVHIYGRVGDVLLRMKTKIVGTGEAVRIKAIKTVDRATKAIQAYKDKAASSVLSIKGRVGDIVVAAQTDVSAKAYLVKSKVVEAYGRMQKAIAELPVTAKITNGVTLVQTKAGAIAIYVKDGYMHVAHKVEGKVIYMKARVVQSGGVVKVRIVEAYMTTKSLLLDVASSVKVNAISAAELAKAKAMAALDGSKALAAEKPIAASAAGGAVVGGVGGGAAGLATGGFAGAALGVPFALVTFGLSIPFGATVGGSVGACIGATAGGVAGAASGTAVGYGFEHRAQIKKGVKTGMDGAIKKVHSFQDLGSGLKAKVLRSGTGSTN